MSRSSKVRLRRAVSNRRLCSTLGNLSWLLFTGVLTIAGCDTAPSSKPLVEYDNGDASPAVLRRHCANKGDVWTRSGCVRSADIKVNTVGYVPGRIKLATIPADTPATTFSVKDVATEATAFSGLISEDVIDVTDTGERVKLADFTDLVEPGTYVIDVPGMARSTQFEVADTVYEDVLKSSLLGLYGQRCGSEVKLDFDGDTFTHGKCHQSDATFNASFTPNESGNRDATGGWHDAGDYGKYTVNGAFSVAFLIKAWEDFGQPLASVDHIPNGSVDVPSILAEARYQLDWLVKMQQSDGGVLHLVCPTNFPPDSLSPDGDRSARYFLQASTSATAYFTAALASAARAFRPLDASYADKLLAAAQLSELWLQANPTAISAANGTREKSFVAGGPYNISPNGDAAARNWALVEIWRTTGDGDIAAIESALGNMSVATSWDWAGVGNLAMFSYAAAGSGARNAETLAKIQGAIADTAETLVTNAQRHGYGRALAPSDYNWGSNGTVARSTLTLWAAYHVTNDVKYLNAATQQLDYLLGRNPFGRSFVTGVGFAPPANPHHRPSNADNVMMPWPGLLVGGSHKDANDPRADDCISADGAATPGKCWFDESGDYYVNEIAINWNASLIYAVAGFVQ